MSCTASATGRNMSARSRRAEVSALWLSDETLARWRAEPPPRRRRGHPRLYSEEAITALLALSALYHLGLRETAGLVRSVVAALGLALPVPDHTTLSRRRAGSRCRSR